MTTINIKIYPHLYGYGRIKMPNECTICSLIQKNSKSFIVFEDDLFISFLDSKPLFIGHCLLAPKQHIHTIYDLPANQGNALLQTIQKIGFAITNAMDAEGTFIAVNNKVSQSIDHLHMHIVPRKKGDGLKGFFWPRTNYQNEEQMVTVQLAIKKELDKRE